MKNYMAELNYYKECGIIPNFSELERKYNVDRRTLKKYYDIGYVPARKVRKYTSVFDPYEDIIKAKIKDTANSLIGIYLFLEDKYEVKSTYSNFKSYCKRRGLKIAKTPVPHVRYETPEGEQLQVDWKEDLEMYDKNGEIFKFNLYGATLGYSRKHIFIYTANKTEDDFIRCTIDAYRRLGGMTKILKTDNMSAIVSVRGNTRVKHKRIIQFGKDLGIKIKLCDVRTPETKGKVESSNRFIKRLFAYNGEFSGLNELLEIIDKINNQINSEPNQDTNIPPNILFKKEKEYLMPLPNLHLLDSYLTNVKVVKVPNTLLVPFEGKGYSVPKEYIGKDVKVIKESNTLYIYSNTALISMHQISNNTINYRECDYIDALKDRLKNKVLSNGFDIDALAKQNLERFNNNGK